MARKATDLLDVFRLGAAEPPPQRATKARAGRAKAARGADRIVVAQRHLVLGGSVVVLLLALSFTLGLGVGRGGRAPQDRPALSRTTVPWWIAGTVRSFDVVTAGNVAADPEAVRTHLGRAYDLDPAHVRVRRKGDVFEVRFGPFRSEDDARRAWKGLELEIVRVGSAAPWRHPAFLQEL